jgi:hypothetical protein
LLALLAPPANLRVRSGLTTEQLIYRGRADRFREAATDRARRSVTPSATMTVEEDARAELEARYLGGQASLFSDAEAEWSRFAELVDSLWSLSEKLVPLTPAEERRVSKDGERLFDERVGARAHKLADDARISTFDRLGEQRRALAILERRLGA